MNRLQRFFSDNWTILRHDLENTVALILPCIISGNIEGAVAQLSKAKCSCMATTAPYMAKWYELDDIALPIYSIAVINLAGTLYSWESEWLIRQIEAAELNPSICGIVLVIDGPGGMVSHLDAAAAAVEHCKKPTAAVVTGIMASAHFWLGTSANRTFIASPLCEVGSVGIVCTHYSFREYFRQNGIDYREIYPDTADLKNREYRAIVDSNDEEPMKAKAEKIHKLFSESVARNLGISYDPELPLFRGEMFDANEAVKLGYIDQFGGIKDAVTWVLAQATSLNAEELYN
ncbi:MAG: S49 family peptidase [Clostridium sp.]|nr:S49 family peptidase [Clostridium sp.]